MKIKPTKYTNTDLSVLGLSIEIVNILNRGGSEKYDQLLRKVTKAKGEFAKRNFLAALVFLYSLGKVNYHQESDMIILENKNETF